MERKMTVTVAKWGNSLAVRIPASEAAKAAIKEGDEVDLTASQKGRLIIRKINKEANFDHLYAQMTSDNCHSETDWGVSVGRENIEW
jgi:antitoxin MazE